VFGAATAVPLIRMAVLEALGSTGGLKRADLYGGTSLHRVQSVPPTGDYTEFFQDIGPTGESLCSHSVCGSAATFRLRKWVRCD
jgi:hypothetical protein